MLRQSALTFGILALALWALSWSWLIGVGVTVVRIGEVGASVAGVAAVAIGAATWTRARNAGLWMGLSALVLVVGLNLVAVILR